jgi:hypothetical protein
MGVRRVVKERDFRKAWEVARLYRPFWGELDITSLSRKLEDPRYYNGGIISITVKEYRAWPELNRRIIASHKRTLRSPLLAWVARRGLYPVIRMHGQLAHPSP